MPTPAAIYPRSQSYLEIKEKIQVVPYSRLRYEAGVIGIRESRVYVGAVRNFISVRDGLRSGSVCRRESSRTDFGQTRVLAECCSRNDYRELIERVARERPII